MATVSSSANHTSDDHERLDIESVRTLVVSVNQHISEFLEDPEARKSLQLRCTSNLKIEKQEFFEFSEHSILSNLYWGILNVEAAIQAKHPEEGASRLKNTERMLQVPALLGEHGSTGGIQNRNLVCSSYFYLSLVRNLQKDEWQATLHFLQALLVCPRLVRMEFIPEIWESVFVFQIMNKNHAKSGWRGLKSESLDNFCDDAIDEMTRQQARRYKDWLMYYQVMSYGETPQFHLTCRVASSLGKESQSSMSGMSTSTKYLDSVEEGNGWPKFQDGSKVHPPDVQETKIDEMTDGAKASIVTAKQKFCPLQDYARALFEKRDEVYNRDMEGNLGIKNLQDMLEESQSSTSLYSHNDYAEGSDSEAQMDDSESSIRIRTEEAENTEPEIVDWELQATCSVSSPECKEKTSPEAPGYLMHEEAYEGYTSYFFSSTNLSSVSDLNLLSVSERKNIDPNTFDNWHVEEGESVRRSEQHNFRFYNHFSAKALKGYGVTHMGHQRSSARNVQDSNSRKNLGEVSLHPENNVEMEILETFETTVSALCLSEQIGKCEDDSLELSTIWEMLNIKTEMKYEMLKDVILDQLLNAISTSKEERVIRASVSILSTLISENRTVIEEIKKKGLRLCDLVSALKRNVHEAVILIYLINPSPAEMKGLELLPALLEVACNPNSKGGPTSTWLTPPAASLAIIEVLVTALDYATNNMHLAAISSTQVLSRLLHVARNNNIKGNISLAAILIKCMQFDGNCRSFISQFTPMAPFLHLLRSKEKHAKFTALQFFHEILCMPRSSAISLLHQIQQPDSINIMHTLMSCIQQSEPEYRLMAANLLLQLDMLEDSSGRSIFREEAIEVLLESIVSEESSATQILSAFILSNLGGTYAWTGEPYTAAWMVIKTGLTSLHHRNMIRNFDWSDQSLQDSSTDAWCSKIARSLIRTGEPVFHTLEKGLRSKIKSVSRDCLIAIAWLGCEIAVTSPSNVRYSACEILLGGIERFLHPGSDLEERLLACLCVYNYASGKGVDKLIHFSEGVRESLRRLSSITWMAEELLKVTDYFLQTKSRISCVHTQILEMGHSCGGAASALIYYKGQLYSGHSDGSIKVWDIKGQIAKLVWDVKEHKKAVTCFTLFEPEGSLLSGSDDRTIRVWKMVQRKLECIEVIRTTEQIHRIDTYGQLIFLITQSRGLKVFDASRAVKVICKSKHVKCLAVVQQKIYLGCTDSSIQEVDITNDREREIKAPAKSWLKQNRPINSVIAYNNWLYVASSIVEGSNLKEWRRHNDPKISITVGKGTNVQIMGVIEDFIYLNCSSSPSILQIWLRGTQQKVGRLSAGSRITSLLTANDIVICGTETGLIKGWIPL
ncbi:WD40 repeat [Macleaya cordata]|uniref:WD40 repeat n=1 Tax=Macleaya cordata TaxID=56857 RepID=A0A200PPU2_MACCD|nr:WD40 repeat [Macleaya cordata]